MALNTLTGKIIDYNIDGNKLDLTILGKEKVKATYYIDSEVEQSYLKDNLLVGSIVKLYGSFSEPLNNTIPNTFNYKNYLYNKKIYRLFSIDRYELSHDINIIYKIKNWIIKRTNSNEELTPYFKTFILGDKREMNMDDYNNFQSNGVSHLFAISGMHVSLFSSLLFFLFKSLKITEKKSFVIVFIFLCFYAFLTGFPASIMRAVVFMLFLNLNKFLCLKISNTKCLLLTLSSLLFFNPFFLFDLGFLYSVITVLSLLLCSNFIKGNYVVKTFKVSLVAFFFSMPLTLYTFYEINLLSPLINVLFVPFVSFIIYPLVLLNFLFCFLTPITLLVLKILTILNTLSASLDFFIINIPKIPFIIVIFIYLLLLGFIKTKRKMFLVLLCSLLLLFKIRPKLDANAYVCFLDVGQGDSAVIISSYQKEVVMIDTGGEVKFKNEDWEEEKRTYKKSSNTITFLKSLGIKKIDLLVLSHGDADHAGEAINILESLKIKKIMLNEGEYNSLEKNVLVQNVSQVKNYDSKYLNFMKLNYKLYDNENDNSINLVFNIYNKKILFMGDSSVKVEHDLIEKYNLSNIDILKVGHHGSKTSSSYEFLKTTNPKYSIISSGRNNRYNHPHDLVINNLKSLKLQYYNTQESGTILFKISKNSQRIFEYKP